MRTFFSSNILFLSSIDCPGHDGNWYHFSKFIHGPWGARTLKKVTGTHHLLRQEPGRGGTASKKRDQVFLPNPIQHLRGHLQLRGSDRPWPNRKRKDHGVLSASDRKVPTSRTFQEFLHQVSDRPTNKRTLHSGDKRNWVPQTVLQIIQRHLCLRRSRTASTYRQTEGKGRYHCGNAGKVDWPAWKRKS